MNYKRITKRVRVRDLFKILLLIGFVLASTRLENFHRQSEDYYYNLAQVNNELVIYEHSNDKHIFLGNDEEHEVASTRTEFNQSVHSFTYTINSYNGIILTVYKAIISNINYCSEIISIIQKTNIWHKSSNEEPVLN